MKNSILLALVMLLSSIVSVDAADYDGATKYPVTTLVSGQFTLVVSGVVQTKTFSQLHTAMATAVVTSQKCSCDVVIKSPDIRVGTKWRVVTAADAPVTLSWARPVEREGGEPLRADELQDYTLMQQSTLGVTLAKLTIPANNLDSIQYATSMPYSQTDKFSVAANDKNGLSSQFVELSPYVGR